jgi:Xaa-Pro aminopeptidase
MPHAPSRQLSDRHRAIRDHMQTCSLDALVVTSLPNVTYLSNFGGSSAIVLMTLERLLFITDFRYVTVVSNLSSGPSACPNLELVVVDSSYDATLASTLASLGLRRIGFEAANLTVARLNWLRDTFTRDKVAAELLPTEGVVERARVRKDAYELDVLREAARRLSDVASKVFALVGRGRTEREVALDIDWEIRTAGFERTAFDTIVAGGPNAALPHARPSERKLTEGDLVVLDFGGVYDSYCVDLTRTVSIGPAGVRARNVHAAVLAAHDRAIQSVRPGRSRFDIDGAARATLGDAGMADAFGHGTGHGLGIEVHEDPRISKRRPGETDDDGVTPGMVFTIEPGAYFPEWGGVRIEDDVLVTETGVEVLTHVTTDLLEISS